MTDDFTQEREAVDDALAALAALDSTTCEECDGYRHCKRHPLTNGGWCPACCNSDGTPKETQR